jgi:hypothetical protein
MGRCSRRYAQVSLRQRLARTAPRSAARAGPGARQRRSRSSDYVDTAAGGGGWPFLLACVPWRVSVACPGGPAQISGVAHLQRRATAPCHRTHSRGRGSRSHESAGSRRRHRRRVARDRRRAAGSPGGLRFVPGLRPGRSALSLRYKVRGPSRARLLTSRPRRIRCGYAARGGLDVEPARCVLSKLLAGAASAQDAIWRRTWAVRERCGLTEAVVGGFLAGSIRLRVPRR